MTRTKNNLLLALVLSVPVMAIIGIFVAKAYFCKTFREDYQVEVRCNILNIPEYLHPITGEWRPTSDATIPDYQHREKEDKPYIDGHFKIEKQ